MERSAKQRLLNGVTFVKVLAERLAKRFAPYKGKLGKMVMVCGVSMALLGFPFQIHTNYVAKTCGIDPVLVLLAFGLYVVRIPYQISARAWYLFPADIIGFLLSGVLIGQWILYR